MKKKLLLFCVTLIIMVVSFTAYTSYKKQNKSPDTDSPTLKQQNKAQDISKKSDGETSGNNTKDILNQAKMPTDIAMTDTKLNLYGTTPGNMMNSGLFTSQGNWMYYTIPYNSINKGSLFRSRLDGETAFKEITKPDTSIIHSCINVVGEWIYYINHIDNSSIFKVKIDGTQTEKLTTESAYQICVINNYIYFTNQGGLKRVNIDGTGLQIIYSNTTNDSISFSFDENYLYISIMTEIYEGQRGVPSNAATKLYRINYDGSSLKLINEKDAINLFMPYKNWIFYINRLDNHLYRIKNDGTNRTKLVNDNINSFNIADDTIYYADYSSLVSFRILKINLDGSRKTELYKNIDSVPINNIFSISTAGDSIFFVEYGKTISIVRAKKDGSLIKYIF